MLSWAKSLLMQKEKDGLALFVDNSGSVGGSENYWSTVEHIVQKYAKDIAHYYIWNSTCNKATLKELETNIKSKKGTGGTSPENVAKTIVDQRLSNIILVTDGEVGDHSVQSCDKIFDNASKDFKISKSICFMVSTGYG